MLDHLARQLGGRPAYPGRPHNFDAADAPRELKKIEALLAEAGRPWSYADAIAKRICGVERVAWCKSAQLAGVIAALSVDAERHGRRTR